ncbi:MAG TPA: flagellar biosynthesis protein, partial [Methylibium sp.]
ASLIEALEPLSPQLSYLSARGLPLRHVDANGGTAGFLQAVADAAPFAEVVLVHAPASELARMFAQRPPGVGAPRAVLLCDERPEAMTHAYAALKLLAARSGVMVHDLLLGAAPRSARASLIAQRLARCADDFLGAVQHSWVRIDPAEPVGTMTSPALRRLVEALLPAAWLPSQSGAFVDSAFDALMNSHPAAALPVQRVPLMN